MRLYSGTTASLIDDTTKNRIAVKLTDAFFHEFRFQPAPSEVNSWRNSLRAVSQVFQEGNLLNNGVILEFQLPLTSRRLDCVVTGRNDWSRENAVIVEVKQWEKCEDGGGCNEVSTWLEEICVTFSTRQLRSPTHRRTSLVPRGCIFRPAIFSPPQSTDPTESSFRLTPHSSARTRAPSTPRRSPASQAIPTRSLDIPGRV